MRMSRGDWRDQLQHVTHHRPGGFCNCFLPGTNTKLSRQKKRASFLRLKTSTQSQNLIKSPKNETKQANTNKRKYRIMKEVGEWYLHCRIRKMMKQRAKLLGLQVVFSTGRGKQCHILSFSLGNNLSLFPGNNKMKWGFKRAVALYIGPGYYCMNTKRRTQIVPFLKGKWLSKPLKFT